MKPNSRDELLKIIEVTIEKEGLNCDLNFIDTSLITDMSFMFYNSKFNGNISNWGISNIANTRYMFCSTKVNKDF